MTMNNDDINAAKEELRTKMRGVRASISIIEMAALSARICGRVLAQSAYKNAHTVMCYSGLNGEVSTNTLLKAVLRDGKTLCMPVVRTKTTMEAVRCDDPDKDLAKGAFGIMEPIGQEIIAPEDIDLVLIPGLAFSPEGDRLGYGAGYYDRYLDGCVNAVFMGLAYEKQIISAVPSDEFDKKLDYVITEERSIDCK